jgi:hypothetical protein
MSSCLNIEFTNPISIKSIFALCMFNHHLLITNLLPVVITAALHSAFVGFVSVVVSLGDHVLLVDLFCFLR